MSGDTRPKKRASAIKALEYLHSLKGNVDEGKESDSEYVVDTQSHDEDDDVEDGFRQKKTTTFKTSFIEKLINVYQQHLSKPKVFPSLIPTIDDYQLIETKFSFQCSENFPKFKTTHSMDMGDNNLKYIKPLEAMRSSPNSLIFNVGQCVTSAAWCPLPLIRQYSSCEINNLFKQEAACERDQYLAIATSFYDDLLQLRTSSQVFLQIWNTSHLTSFGSVQDGEARLAMNINMTGYGEILHLCWCPLGSSYENYESTDTSQSYYLIRLGLIACATEDGYVRIFSLAHPIQLKGSYEIGNIFQVEPVLTLQNRFDCYVNCNSVDWFPYYPFHMIVAGFNDGHICLWKLSHCTNSNADIHINISPDKIYHSCKYLPILNVRWINAMMFLGATLENCKQYHLKYDSLYDEIACRISCRMVDVHPSWSDSFLIIDSMLSRQSNSILLRTCNKFVNLVNVNNCLINDMSLSPWMHVLAFTTDTGQLYTTTKLKKPSIHAKKMQNCLLYSVHLAENFLEKFNDDNKNDLDLAKNKTTMVKPKKILVNETLDLKHTLESFKRNYYFIFEDSPEKSLSKPIQSKNISSEPVTTNDLYQYYSLTNCAWNPNASSYSWIFTSTKSGLCRIHNYPITDPRTI